MNLKTVWALSITVPLVLLIPMSVLCVGSEEAHAQSEGESEEEEPININRIAVLDTDYGIIKFELYENWTPITTANFIELAESGHYDGVDFHRIVDDFVIQTGDGTEDVETIPLEIHPNATHVDGAVGMARGDDPDSASDQFYICDGPQHGLDDESINPEEDDTGYTVFGVVVEGMEVVRQIAEVPVWGENNPRPGSLVPSLTRNVGMPKELVYLNKVTIENPADNMTENDTFAESEGTVIPFTPMLGVILLLILVAIIAVMFFVVRR